jgi:hypothetical protein
MWRDPLNWLVALARLRFSKVDPMGEIERTRAAEAALQPVRTAQPMQGALAQP